MEATPSPRHAIAAVTKSVHILESNTDAPNATLQTLKNPKSAGLILRSNTAVRLASLLEYVGAEIMDVSSKAALAMNRMRVTDYIVRLALWHDKELLAFFDHLGVVTEVSGCMEIPKGFRGYPTRRKDGSQPPPFHADKCFEYGQIEERGVDGSVYVTDGTRWTKKPNGS